jgi:hypothetical protein
MLLIGFLISSLSLVAIPVASGETVTSLTIISPTTDNPAYVQPGGAVVITYQITVNNLTQVVDIQVSIVGVKTENPPVITPPGTTFTLTTSVSIPENTQPGTYDVRVRARQPATGQWQKEVTMPSAVIVQSPTPPLSITAPDDITVEGNTIGGATGVNLGTPTVSGGTPPYTITNDAPTFFPLGETIVTWTVTDAAGNTASDTQIVTVVDTIPPTIQAPDTLTVLVNAPKSVLTGTATDIVDPNPTLTNDAPDFFPPGTTTVTWTAEDSSGNTATKTTIVTAIYSFSGFLAPLGSGTFKAGSTIPVKFQLTDYYGNYISTATAQISVDSNPGASSGSSNNGNYFRYDPTNNQYIFNLSTKGMSPGTHTITVTLDDGTTPLTTITLK